MAAYSTSTIYYAKQTHLNAPSEEGFHTSAFCWGSSSGHTSCSLEVCWVCLRYKSCSFAGHATFSKMAATSLAPNAPRNIVLWPASQA